MMRIHSHETNQYFVKILQEITIRRIRTKNILNSPKFVVLKGAPNLLCNKIFDGISHHKVCGH